jgi:O-acetyl-ADP-ribose deacetylase (regulator of RNase III)
LIKIVEGNILNAPENIIGHQVNCQGVMGAGLAKQIRSKYPKVYEDYMRLINWAKEEHRRGYLKSPSLLNSCQFVNVSEGKTIANIFGQDKYGRKGLYTDYNALKRGLWSIYESVTNPYNTLHNNSVALPYGLGCGLAGGDWEIVYKIIEEIFDDYELTLYKYI